MYAELSGQERPIPKFSSSIGNAAADSAKIMDTKASTFWSNNARQQVGQWYCLDHGSTININNICLITGGTRRNDYPECVQFELSDDGKNWSPIGSPQRGNVAIVNLSKEPARARYVRFRITEPRPNWLSICEFAVNRSLPPYVDSSVTGCNLTAYSNKGDIGINRVMEVCQLSAGGHITLELPSPVYPEWMEINLENPNLATWGTIEATLESGRVVQLQAPVHKNRFYLRKAELPNERIAALRVTNKGASAQEIKVTIFRIGITEGALDTDTRTITDADIATSYLCSKAALDVSLPVPEGSTELILVGNAAWNVTNASLTREGEHVRRYKLTPGATSVRITHPRKEQTFLNEAIFR